MIEAYLDELGRELGAVGIRGRLRDAASSPSPSDHLRCDPEAPARFGAPARAGEHLRRRAGSASVATGRGLGVRSRSPSRAPSTPSSFVGAAFAGSRRPTLAGSGRSSCFPSSILAPQVAFVAGSLALVRALRRRERPAPERRADRDQPPDVGRRSPRARDDGRASWPSPSQLRTRAPDWWVASTLARSPGRLAAARCSPRCRRPAPRGSGHRSPGEAGDSFDDLGFGRTDPWRFAGRVAFAVGPRRVARGSASRATRSTGLMPGRPKRSLASAASPSSAGFSACAR